jgi:fermentation-respiration switch protein FrsA (DUF1100 family)
MDGLMFNSTALDAYNLPDSVIPVHLREEVSIASEGETLFGFFVRQEDSLRIKPHPVIIYHHGNRDHTQYYWDRVEFLWKCGFDVFVYDYRGFGKSTGTSSEESLFADATAVLNYVRSRVDVDTNQIVHYGFSLGGVPALFSTAEFVRPRCIILEAVYATGEDLVHSGTLLDIPGEYLLEGAFDNVSRIGKIDCPVLMLHGTADSFIGIERHGDKLYNAAKNPKTFIRVEGANHEDVPQTMGVDTYITTITAFVRGS